MLEFTYERAQEALAAGTFSEKEYELAKADWNKEHTFIGAALAKERFVEKVSELTKVALLYIVSGGYFAYKDFTSRATEEKVKEGLKRLCEKVVRDHRNVEPVKGSEIETKVPQMEEGPAQVNSRDGEDSSVHMTTLIPPPKDEVIEESPKQRSKCCKVALGVLVGVFAVALAGYYAGQSCAHVQEFYQHMGERACVAVCANVDCAYEPFSGHISAGFAGSIKRFKGTLSRFATSLCGDAELASGASEADVHITGEEDVCKDGYCYYFGERGNELNEKQRMEGVSEKDEQTHTPPAPNKVEKSAFSRVKVQSDENNLGGPRTFV